VFLGFANFYRRFIYNYSRLAAGLNNLLGGYQKDPKKKWEWPSDAIEAFENLRAAFSTAPVLVYFDPTQPIIIQTNASDFAMAGILLQPSGTATGTERHPRLVGF